VGLTGPAFFFGTRSERVDTLQLHPPPFTAVTRYDKSREFSTLCGMHTDYREHRDFQTIQGDQSWLLA
jgi:hypothetical protein